MRKLLFYFFLRVFRLPKSTIPVSKKGLIIILIDGLSYTSLQAAVKKKQCSFFSKLLKKGYVISPYYCGPPAATTATEAELFFGTHENIPGFTWFDRTIARFVRGNRGEEIELFENTMKKKYELLKNGSCILGVYSAGATQCDLSGKNLNVKKPFRSIRKLNTIFFLWLNPLRFFLAILLLLKSIFSSITVFVLKKSRRKLKTMIRDSVSHIILGNAITSLAELEILRETPVLFIDYVLYDEFAHTYGVNNKTSLASIRLIDWCSETLYKNSQKSKRKYDFIILSDHGQTPSHPLNKSQQSIEDVFSSLLRDNNRVVIKTYGDFDAKKMQIGKDVYLIPAGSTLQVYFSEKLKTPYFMDELSGKYPSLISGLVKEKEIGWVLVRKNSDTQLLIGKHGTATFKKGKVDNITGIPFHNVAIEERVIHSLAQYAANTNNGDLVLFANTLGDGKLYSFEEHLGTHGGFYGDMVKPFIITDNSALTHCLAEDNSMEHLFKQIRSSQMGA